MMKLLQTRPLGFGVGLLGGAAVTIVSALITIGGSHGSPATLAAQVADRAQPRAPIVDEYYPVKQDWIGNDRSIVTIRHTPTGSCYILVYPSGQELMPVEARRCTLSRPVER